MTEHPFPFHFLGNDGEDLLQKIEEVEHQPDCPVCLQPCHYPVKLPCGHIFCFLCIKGVALRSRRCALCRQTITADCIEHPTLVKVVGGKTKEAVCKTESEQVHATVAPSDSEDKECINGEYVWFYEGRNGWWQYDEKTSTEVEKSFKTGKRSCTLLIAGFLYVVDFENMFQTRKNEPGRRRRIKRDKPGAESKGVAGIRAPPKRLLNAKTESTEASLVEKKDSPIKGRQEDGASSGEASTGDLTGNDSETQQGGGTEQANDSVEDVALRLEAVST